MLLSVLFMFFCAILLVPFIAFAMCLLIKGDAERVRDAAAHVAGRLELEGPAGERHLATVEAPAPHGSTKSLHHPLQTA